MRRKLPSISALTAFEAAARHASITRAANELSLTESAVSRQISLLEEQLGVRLFNRIKKRISLTHAGRVYAAQVTQILRRMERDTLEIMAHEGDFVNLEIASLPTVGAEWLIPRLGDFYARHPNVTIHLSARSTRFFFAESPFDGALYFGGPKWPGARTVHLFDEELVPVGRPELLQGQRQLPHEVIVQHRLLHLFTRPDAWRQWCARAGLDDINAMRGPRFEIQSMLINAATAGLGVALLPRFLIGEPLQNNKLCVLSDLAVRSEGAYYFAYPEEQEGEIQLAYLCAWLQEQAAPLRRSLEAKSTPEST